VSRDKADLSKVAEKLDSFTPFPADESLRSIITGINANEDVNVQDLFEIGKGIVQKMDGQSIFSYAHKRSLKVKTLASSKNVNVSEDRSIDPALLFQRFLVVSQTGDLRLDDVMSYHPMKSVFTRCLCSKERTFCVNQTNQSWQKLSETMLKPSQIML